MCPTSCLRKNNCYIFLKSSLIYLSSLKYFYILYEFNNILNGIYLKVYVNTQFIFLYVLQLLLLPTQLCQAKKNDKKLLLQFKCPSPYVSISKTKFNLILKKMFMNIYLKSKIRYRITYYY